MSDVGTGRQLRWSVAILRISLLPMWLPLLALVYLGAGAEHVADWINDLIPSPYKRQPESWEESHDA